MGQILNDGTVIPAFLAASSVDTSSSNNAIYDIFNDDNVHIGTVVAAYAPDSVQNTSKKVWQYDVNCSVSNGLELSIPQIYPRCVVASMFGGVADSFRWKPRLDASQNDSSNTSKLENNAQVLIVCPDGDSRMGFIIGAIPNSEAAVDPAGSPPGDLYMIGEYNGVNITVNNDGELTIVRKGPTQIDGTPVDSNDDKVGANISLFKNGDVSIENGKGDKILFNFSDRGIEIHTDKNINITSDNGKIITSSTNVQLGGTSEHLVLGDTYRKAEDQYFSDLNDFMTKLIIGLGTVAPGLVMDAGAGASLATLIGQLTPFLKSFPTFKAQSATYLSQVNTTK